jgi:serine/threonine protein kinase
MNPFPFLFLSVLFYELFSYGNLPFGGLSNAEAREKVIKGGQLPRPSEETPNEIYELILKCTAKNPSDRPSFAEIALQIRQLIGEEGPSILDSSATVAKKEPENAYEMTKSMNYIATTDSKEPEYTLHSSRPVDD